MTNLIPVSVPEKAIEEAAEMAREFLGKLANPALEEGGGILGDTVKFWRFKNRINLVLKTKKFLEAKGINPALVLPKTLLPIIENGSLEEDEAMRDRWSAMLAHAADPSSGVTVRPSYPEILKQLSSVEVQILDNFYESVKDKPTEEREKIGIDGSKVQSVFGIARGEYEILIVNLLRLGVCEMPSSKGGASIGDAPIALHTYEITYLSPLGVDFIKACKY